MEEILHDSISADELVEDEVGDRSSLLVGDGTHLAPAGVVLGRDDEVLRSVFRLLHSTCRNILCYY